MDCNELLETFCGWLQSVCLDVLPRNKIAKLLFLDCCLCPDIQVQGLEGPRMHEQIQNQIAHCNTGNQTWKKWDGRLTKIRDEDEFSRVFVFWEEDDIRNFQGDLQVDMPE